MKYIKSISAAVGLIIAIGGVIWGVESRYSTKSFAQEIRVDVDVHLLQHREDRIIERIWTLQKQFGFDETKYPEVYYKEYSALKVELERIRMEISSKMVEK